MIAVAPSEDLAFVLQMAGVGALIGAVVAARRRARDPQYDAWLVTARWTLALALLAVLFVVRDRLG